MTEERRGVVLITGCSSGIGRAMAESFLARKFRVVATARKVESIRDLEEKGAEILPLDVTDENSIWETTSRVEKEIGPLEILVNNAGYGAIGPTAELPLEEVRKQFETNVFGALALIQAVVPSMARRKRGLLVNIGSVSGVTATPFAGAYCASKAALHLFGDALRMELAPFGIRVVTVQPGGIRSNFADRATSNLENSLKKDSLYTGILAAIEERAHMSQGSPTSAEEFAEKTVAAVLQRRPPAVFRYGHGSRLMPMLKATLPGSLLDRIMRGKFHLDRLD